MMRRYKRIISIVIAFVLVCSLMAGCGEPESVSSNVDVAEAAKTDIDTTEAAKTDVAEEDSTPKEEATIELISGGVSDYVIVRAALATKTEKNASLELQSYLKQISGVEIPVVVDSETEVEKEIIVGKTNREKPGDFDRNELGEDGFVIKTEKDKLWLVGGGDRGTIYSVYTFLEEYLGCRFYTEFVEKIPQMDTVAVPESINDKQIPQLFYRDLGMGDYAFEGISVKRKLNISTWGRVLSGKNGGGHSYATGNGGHSFSFFVDPKVYYRSHPEYFSMNNKGERISDGQLCLTNPDVLQLVIKGAREWLERDPNADIITITQNDIQNPCMCENCMKVYEEEGGAYSGALIRFVNAVAEDLAKDYPDLMIDTYAYQYTRSAPSTVRPADNVIVRFCTIEGCFSHPFDNECDARGSVSNIDGTYNTIAEDLEAWSKICKNLWVYDYEVNFSFVCMPFPNFDNLRENMRWFAEHGIVGGMLEGNHTYSVEMGELRAYLLSKLLWNPYMSEEEFNYHMDDFLEGVYGPGGKYIREYIELAEDLTEGLHFDLGAKYGVYEMYPLVYSQKHTDSELPDDLTADMIKNYEETDWSKYYNWYNGVEENRITVEGEKLFQSAMAAAETDQQKMELEKIHLQIENLLSYYYYDCLLQGEGDVARLVKNYMTAYPDGFTDEEKAHLAQTVDEYATEQCTKQYEEFNRSLCDRLVDWGLVSGDGISSYLNYLDFDFSLMPSMW